MSAYNPFDDLETLSSQSAGSEIKDSPVVTVDFDDVQFELADLSGGESEVIGESVKKRCSICGDYLPCNCHRFNRYDFSGIIVFLISAWYSWLFLDYVSLFMNENGQIQFASCLETFFVFCYKQDIEMIFEDFRYILPIMALTVNILCSIFVLVNKPKPMKWVISISKIIITVVIVLTTNLDDLVTYFVRDNFMFGGLVWWLSTTVINILCTTTQKRGRHIDNALKQIQK